MRLFELGSTFGTTSTEFWKYGLNLDLGIETDFKPFQSLSAQPMLGLHIAIQKIKAPHSETMQQGRILYRRDSESLKKYLCGRYHPSQKRRGCNEKLVVRRFLSQEMFLGYLVEKEADDEQTKNAVPKSPF